MDFELFEKYNAELAEELDLSDFNMKDVQMKMPSIKHKWVARLIQQKIELNKLNRLKSEALENIMESEGKSAPVALSDAALSKKAERHEVIQRINDKIQQCKIMIEYLEKVEKVCNSTTYDIRNLVDIKKLELT